MYALCGGKLKNISIIKGRLTDHVTCYWKSAQIENDSHSTRARGNQRVHRCYQREGALRADQKSQRSLGLVICLKGRCKYINYRVVPFSLIFFDLFDVAVICVYAGVVCACVHVCGCWGVLRRLWASLIKECVGAKLLF